MRAGDRRIHGVDSTGIRVTGNGNVIGRNSNAAIMIAYNGQTGVVVAFNDADVRNVIRGNNIYLNGSPGIDLGDDGVTTNDPQDPDAGPNNFQNFPVLTSITLSGGTATISGTPNSAPNSTVAIDLFVTHIWDTTTCGEAQKYLGSTTVTTDASGIGSFTATPGGVPAGWNYFAARASASKDARYTAGRELLSAAASQIGQPLTPTILAHAPRALPIGIYPPSISRAIVDRRATNRRLI